MNHAHQYASTNDMQRRDAASTLREFFPRLRWDCGEDSGEDGDEAVLDVGSGTGDVTAEVLLPLLPARVRRVVGADVSPVMVRHAAGAHAHLRPRLRFVQADIAAADLRASPLRAEAGERGFSKIFSFYCLHWVYDQSTAVANMLQLLRPGGEALLVFLAQCPVFTLYETLSKQLKWQPYMTDAHKYISAYQHSRDPAHDFSSLVIAAGFKVLDCRCIKLGHEFNDMNYMKDAIMAVNPFLERVPDNKKSEYIMDNMKVIHDQKLVTFIEKDKQQKITFSYSLLVALIQKDRH